MCNHPRPVRKQRGRRIRGSTVLKIAPCVPASEGRCQGCGNRTRTSRGVALSLTQFSRPLLLFLSPASPLPPFSYLEQARVAWERDRLRQLCLLLLIFSRFAHSTAHNSFKMDVVLEVCDTFLFDYMYQWVLPARPAPSGLTSQTFANGTSMSTWQYKPATEYLYLTPSQAAYGSLWARDNIWRQGVSLFLILWFVYPFPLTRNAHPQVTLTLPPQDLRLPSLLRLRLPLLPLRLRQENL